VVGRGAVLPISRGDFVLPGKLAAIDAGAGLPSMIPPECAPFPFASMTSSRWPVLCNRYPRRRLGTAGNGNDRQTTTVLQNVAVIAVGGSLLERITGGEQTLRDYPAGFARRRAKLALASQEGRIQLALRNPLDTKKEGIGATAPAPCTWARRR